MRIEKPYIGTYPHGVDPVETKLTVWEGNPGDPTLYPNQYGMWLKLFVHLFYKSNTKECNRCYKDTTATLKTDLPMDQYFFKQLPKDQ